MSDKSVKQECLTGDLRNSVKQGRPTRVSPQCVNSGCLTSEFAGSVTNKYCLCLSTYVSAFGFVGFILFFHDVSCFQIILFRISCDKVTCDTLMVIAWLSRPWPDLLSAFPDSSGRISGHQAKRCANLFTYLKTRYCLMSFKRQKNAC